MGNGSDGSHGRYGLRGACSMPEKQALTTSEDGPLSHTSPNSHTSHFPSLPSPITAASGGLDD